MCVCACVGLGGGGGGGGGGGREKRESITALITVHSDFYVKNDSN